MKSTSNKKSSSGGPSRIDAVIVAARRATLRASVRPSRQTTACAVLPTHNRRLKGRKHEGSSKEAQDGNEAQDGEKQEPEVRENSAAIRNENWHWIKQRLAQILSLDTTERRDEVIRLGETFKMGNPAVRSKIQEIEAEIEKVTDIFAKEAICPVCFELLEIPFVTECGHVFCGDCLENHFKLCLQTTLQKFVRVHCATESREPRFEDGPQKLAEIVKRKGLNVSRFFSYPCPTCRAKINKAPTFSVRLRTLALGLKEVLDPTRESNAEGNLLEVLDGGNAGRFDSVFLRNRR